MFEHLTCNDKVKRLLVKFVGGNVVLANFKVGGLDCLEELRLEIGCDDFATRSYATTEPLRD